MGQGPLSGRESAEPRGLAEGGQSRPGVTPRDMSPAEAWPAATVTALNVGPEAHFPEKVISQIRSERPNFEKNGQAALHFRKRGAPPRQPSNAGPPRRQLLEAPLWAGTPLICPSETPNRVWGEELRGPCDWVWL